MDSHPGDQLGGHLSGIQMLTYSIHRVFSEISEISEATRKSKVLFFYFSVCFLFLCLIEIFLLYKTFMSKGKYISTHKNIMFQTSMLRIMFTTKWPCPSQIRPKSTFQSLPTLCRLQRVESILKNKRRVRSG